MALQCLLGLKCNDFSMLAADQMTINSIIIMTDDDKKIHKINESTIMGVIGDSGDTEQFTQYILKNITLYRIRNSYSLGIDAVAHFAWRNLRDALLKTGRNSGALVAGYDEQQGGRLFLMHGMGASIQVPFAALGLSGMFSLGVMSRYYRSNLTLTEAYDVMKLCTTEIQERFVIQLPKFQVVAVSKLGVRQLPQLVKVVSK